MPVADALPADLTTEQVIDLIFRDPAVKHGPQGFRDLDRKPEAILKIYAETVESGRAKGFKQMSRRNSSNARRNPQFATCSEWCPTQESPRGLQEDHRTFSRSRGLGRRYTEN
jgi:hypothetical protein